MITYIYMCRRCIFGQAKHLIFLALTVFTAMLDNGKTEEAWSGKKDDLESDSLQIQPPLLAAAACYVWTRERRLHL